MSAAAYSYILTAVLTLCVSWFLISRYYRWRLNRDEQRFTDALATKDRDHSRELLVRDTREEYFKKENKRLREELRHTLTSSQPGGQR